MESTVERLRLQPRRMAGDEAAGKIDDCQLGAGLRIRIGEGRLRGCGARRCRAGPLSGQQKDLGDGESAAGHRVGGVGGGIDIEQLAKHGAGAGTGVGGQGQGVGPG